MSTNETDIVKLSINDTFYDWYLRTNQIIDYVNPINVYDVFAGAGLTESRTGTPGTVEFAVATNASLYGINTLVTTQGESLVVLDYDELALGTVSDTSLYAIQNATDQIFYLEASNMLPPNINGNHAFGGVITVADLIVDDGTITLNNIGSSRDNCGLIIESISDTNSENISFTYDTTTEAWYSSEYLGIKSGKGFVTDSTPKAVFPFIATSAQGQVDVRLESTIGGIPERISLEAAFDSTNSLLVSHYLNNSLVNEIVEFTSTGTNGSSVIVKDTIEIVDILNSTPFTQTPVVNSVPITDSSDGYLSSFVNRVVIDVGSAVVGDVVRMNGSSLAKATPSSITNATVIGIVESVNGSDAVVITSGSFSGISGLSGLTAGDVYYLDPNTPGEVTNTNPDNTNGILDKPVFIATGATSGVIIPDFPTVVTAVEGGGSGTINNAFATISIGTTDIAATGEDTLTLVGGDNITITPSGNQITIDCDISSSGTANTFLAYNTSGLLDELAPSSYSVVARPLAAGLSSVVIAPGSLLGRLDDTDDTDNPVQSLDQDQILTDILGFSGNSFIKTIEFAEGTGNTIALFNAEDSESIEIRAGSNISFEYSGGSLYIHSNVISEDTNGGGGPGELQVGVENSTQFTTSILNFEPDYNGSGLSADEFIQFAVRDTSSNISFVSAKPTDNYLKFSFGGATSSHTAGYTFGTTTSSSKNLLFSFAKNSVAKTETLSINLATEIAVDKIKPTLSTSGMTGLILSGGDDANRNTVLIADNPRNVGAGDESTIVINGFDEVPSVDPLGRVSTQNIGVGFTNKCVSMYADATNITTTSGVYSYPFRFFKLIVDEIECASLIATEAVKVQETVNRIVGWEENSWASLSTARITLKDAMDSATPPYGEDGVLLRFEDSLAPSTSRAFIFKPTLSMTGNLTLSKMLVFGDAIRIADPNNNTSWSPYLRFGTDTSSIRLVNPTGANSLIEFEGNTTESTLGTVGVTEGSYSFLTYDDGTDEYHVRIAADAAIMSDTLTLTTTTGSGFKIDNTITPVAGHVLYVNSMTGSIGNLKSGYIIKEWTGAVVPTDPINTLYYSF